MSERRATQHRIVEAFAFLPDVVPMRPRTRAECENGPRPCPWMGCKYHLAIDVSAGGRIVERFSLDELEELGESCALDVADLGGATLEEVGELTRLTRERVRQIEERAGKRLTPRAMAAELWEPTGACRADGRRHLVVVDEEEEP